MNDNQLRLVCPTPNKRPREVTRAMMREAARKVARNVFKTDPNIGEEEEIAEDILRVADLSMDGFNIARALERQCHWSCDLVIANILDHFADDAYALLRAVEKKWGEENPMEPPFAIGIEVKTQRGAGKIAGLDTFSPNSYLVQIDSRLFIIPFEDVSATD